MNTTIAGDDDLGGDPSKKSATHTTSVPLYSDMAGMVSVYTRVPVSVIEPVVMSGNCPTDDPFTVHVTRASGDE